MFQKKRWILILCVCLIAQGSGCNEWRSDNHVNVTRPPESTIEGQADTFASIQHGEPFMTSAENTSLMFEENEKVSEVLASSATQTSMTQQIETTERAEETTQQSVEIKENSTEVLSNEDKASRRADTPAATPTTKPTTSTKSTDSAKPTSAPTKTPTPVPTSTVTPVPISTSTPVPTPSPSPTPTYVSPYVPLDMGELKSVGESAIRQAITDACGDHVYTDVDVNGEPVTYTFQFNDELISNQQRRADWANERDVLTHAKIEGTFLPDSESICSMGANFEYWNGINKWRYQGWPKDGENHQEVYYDYYTFIYNSAYMLVTVHGKNLSDNDEFVYFGYGLSIKEYPDPYGGMEEPMYFMEIYIGGCKYDTCKLSEP